jgi:universal stress protein A
MTPPSAGQQPVSGESPCGFEPWVHSILVPIDFSEGSWVALRHAIPVARLMRAKITLVNVCQAQLVATEFAHLPSQEFSMRHPAEEKLRASAKERIPSELLADIVVRNGVAFDEIVRFAEDGKFDLIVINTRGHTGLKHVLLGSTTERVVEYAPCPVLVIRERAGEAVSDSTGHL